MRIGIDARDLTRRPTGISIYTRGVIGALAAAGGEYIQYFDTGGEASADERMITGPGVSARVLSGTGAVWKQLILPGALLRDRVDVFHSMTSTIPIFRPCRTVVTFCDLFHEVNPEFVPPKTRAAMTRLYRFAARRSDAVIAISENTKRDIVKYYGVPEDKITVIYPGLNEYYRPVEKETVAARLRDELGLERRFLLFVGALSAWRNVSGLLDAFALIEKELPDIDLVIVGQPVWGFDIDSEISSRGLTDRVIVKPRVSDDHLRLLYNGAEIFVFPSLFEGFGLPVIEAMACGTPVIASNVTAIPEAAGKAGLLVNVKDPAALPAAIKTALTDSALRAELISEGFKQARRFSWQDTAAATKKVYGRLG